MDNLRVLSGWIDCNDWIGFGASSKEGHIEKRWSEGIQTVIWVGELDLEERSVKINE